MSTSMMSKYCRNLDQAEYFNEHLTEIKRQLSRFIFKLNLGNPVNSELSLLRGRTSKPDAQVGMYDYVSEEAFWARG